MIAGTGRCVAFSETPWEMDGRNGTSRVLQLADAGQVFKVKLSEDLWRNLSNDVKSALQNVEGIFDWRCTARLDPPARGRDGREIVMEARDPEFFALEPFAPGLSLGPVSVGASGRGAANGTKANA